MKKVIFTVILMSCVFVLFAGGNSENAGTDSQPKKKKDYDIIGGAAGVNLLTFEDESHSLATAGIGLISVSAPIAEKWGYMGQTSLSASVYSSDGSNTSYSDLTVFSLDNIIGFGKGIDIDGRNMSLGAGLHFAVINYSSGTSNTLYSMGPAVMMTGQLDSNVGISMEAHYDSISPSASSDLDDSFKARWGYTFAIGFSRH